MNISDLVEADNDSAPVAKRARIDNAARKEEERIERRIWAGMLHRHPKRTHHTQPTSPLILSVIDRGLKEEVTLEQLLSTRKVDEYLTQEKDLVTIDATCVVSESLKVSGYRLHYARAFVIGCCSRTHCSNIS